MAITLTKPATAPRSRWNTLQILKASRATLIVLQALMLIAAITGIRVHRDAMKTVGKDSAPSIVAAQHIETSLADMDANAANELLGAPGKMPEAVNAYEKDREDAARALIGAAENITYGDSERIPIQSVQVGMGSYERAVQRARDFHERGDAAAVNAYRDAARLMDHTLLPSAEALDKANNEVLERAYKDQASKSSAVQALLVLSGLALLGALAAVQIFLLQRTRRTLNPYLAAATLLMVGSFEYAASAMTTERQQLKVAKEDAFASIHALWRTRAISYSANSDESRYLLDQPHAAEHERNFFIKSGLVAKLPPGMNLQDVAMAQTSSIKVEGFSGYLADELGNITFAGERDAAIDTVQAFEKYLSVDKQIRRLEATGQHAAAVELCIGNKQGQSNWAFGRFDTALGATLDINQKAFDAAVEKGLGALDGMEIRLFIVAAAIAVLMFLGLGVRIKEYE
jgi:hypothetical protein